MSQHLGRFISHLGKGGSKGLHGADRLSSVAFDILDRRPIAEAAAERAAPWEMVTVRLNMKPRPDQRQALALG